jgi:twitching motility protein PilT
MLTREQWEYVEHRGELSAGYAFAGRGRHRIAVSKQINGYEITVRLIADAIPPLEQLGLADGINRLTQFREGLVVFAGAGNSGKTTTMFAMAEAISQKRGGHIITFEDPIEYEIKSGSSQVSQREIGLHTLDYDTALNSALREDPDIVVLGEFAGHKTVLCALALAEAGHLVLASVQATDCARAIDRLLDCPSEPQQLRNMLADSVRAIFAQQLIPRADGQGRVAACEMLINSVSVANIIREAKTQSLVNVMQSGKSQGMVMMDESLRALVEDGVISGEEAYARCKNKPGFKQYLVEAEKTQ